MLGWWFTASRKDHPAASGVVNIHADLMRIGRKVVFPSDPKGFEVVDASIQACADDFDLRWKVEGRASGVVVERCCSTGHSVKSPYEDSQTGVQATRARGAISTGQ